MATGGDPLGDEGWVPTGMIDPERVIFWICTTGFLGGLGYLLSAWLGLIR